jgi:GNAT superfamily N-acetyltransferase
MTIEVRAARTEDADALTRLRVSMFEAMGDPRVADTRWQDAARTWFITHIDDSDVALRLVEVDGVIVAGAVAHVRTHLPSPGSPSGRLVTISNVSTFEEHRGHGYGRLAFDAVLSWAKESSHADVADLFATGMGQGMYAAAGFTVHPMPAMRLPLPET